MAESVEEAFEKWRGKMKLSLMDLDGAMEGFYAGWKARKKME